MNKAEKSNVGELLKKFRPLIDLSIKVIDTVSPPIVAVTNFLVMVYNILPMEIVYAIIGLILTFFGGAFAVTISAAEAFYNTGYETFFNNAKNLYQEFSILWKKSREDDEKDEDGDGIKDVEQITVKELLTRKIAFFFSTCKNP